MDRVFILCFKKNAGQTYFDELKETLEKEGAEILSADLMDEKEFGTLLGTRMLEKLGQSKKLV